MDKLTETLRTESGLQFLDRLEARKTLCNLESTLFPEGLESGSAVELCGKSGVGKSEFLLNLVAKCLLPPTWHGEETFYGLQIHVVYIDNDHHFSMLRLAILLHARITKVFGLKVDQNAIRTLTESALKNLKIVRCQTGIELLETLQYLKNVTAVEDPFPLLIIDSISAFYWDDRMIYENSRNLNDHYQKLSSVLQHLMNVHHVTVFCVSQDLMRPKSREVTEGHSFWGSGGFLGKDIMNLWTWRIRFIADSNATPTTNRVISEIRNKDNIIRQVPFEITDDGITFT